jgi:hypothetical protein
VPLGAYPNRARLKVLARAKVVGRADDPELFTRVGGDAPFHRVFVLRIEGLDWNAPSTSRRASPRPRCARWRDR